MNKQKKNARWVIECGILWQQSFLKIIMTGEVEMVHTVNYLWMTNANSIFFSLALSFVNGFGITLHPQKETNFNWKYGKHK